MKKLKHDRANGNFLEWCNKINKWKLFAYGEIHRLENQKKIVEKADWKYWVNREKLEKKKKRKEKD